MARPRGPSARRSKRRFSVKSSRSAAVRLTCSSRGWAKRSDKQGLLREAKKTCFPSHCFRRLRRNFSSGGRTRKLRGGDLVWTVRSSRQKKSRSRQQARGNSEQDRNKTNSGTVASRLLPGSYPTILFNGYSII